MQPEDGLMCSKHVAVIEFIGICTHKMHWDDHIKFIHSYSKSCSTLYHTSCVTEHHSCRRSLITLPCFIEESQSADLQLLSRPHDF